jgi:hypothetical protein
MANVKEYTIHVPDAKLKRLQQKLELVDFPEHQIEDAGWQYGTPLFVSSLHSPLPRNCY